MVFVCFSIIDYSACIFIEYIVHCNVAIFITLLLMERRQLSMVATVTFFSLLTRPTGWLSRAVITLAVCQPRLSTHSSPLLRCQVCHVSGVSR